LIIFWVPTGYCNNLVSDVSSGQALAASSSFAGKPWAQIFKANFNSFSYKYVIFFPNSPQRIFTRQTQTQTSLRQSNGGAPRSNLLGPCFHQPGQCVVGHARVATRSPFPGSKQQPFMGTHHAPFAVLIVIFGCVWSIRMI